jgi:transposase InsO family protein
MQMGKVEKKRSRKYPRELTRRMGLWLKAMGHNFPLRFLAQRLEVSERTLRNWARGAKSQVKHWGRPTTPATKRFLARLKVARELKRQGVKAGWRPVVAAVGPMVSTRLVQESVSELKKRHAQRRRKWLASRRVSVKVLSPNAIWTQDATHLGRMNRKAVQAEVVKDRATLGYVDVAVGYPANAEEILLMLNTYKQAQSLPLVWATDNGAQYRDYRVQAFLKHEKVVHLFSRPRLPQDNAAAEKGMRELKEEAELGKGVKVTSLEETARKLAFSWEVLDHQRLRGSKGYRTADELRMCLPSWDKKVKRETFYEQACKYMEIAVKGGGTAREKRQAERQAVYETLEQFQLVEITRGGKSFKLATKIPEDIL